MERLKKVAELGKVKIFIVAFKYLPSDLANFVPNSKQVLI